LYSRPHHQRIQRILESLNPELLLRNQCLFGGGTAIVLTHGEYRQSVDVDMVVSSKGGYRELRGLVNSQGIEALMKHPLPLRREARIDQYGIRCAFDIDSAAMAARCAGHRDAPATGNRASMCHDVWQLGGCARRC
jgi:hypothetical protein